jgi:hypothetical protein
MRSNRPSVSRDTRLLLGIVLISVALLWVLARIRFPERAPTPNPVPPVLAQLTPPSAFDDIASTIAQLEARLQPSLAALDVEVEDGARSLRPTKFPVTALRFRDDLALAIVAADGGDCSYDSSSGAAAEVARDRAARLAVIRVPGGPAQELTMWAPRRIDAPRFLVAATMSDAAGALLRPAFVAGMREIGSPIWSDSIWALPPGTDLPSGTFAFTLDGAFAGVAVDHGGHPALVPAATVIAAAERLVREGPKPPGRLGIDVQPLTPAIAAASGSKAGVVVAWVDPDGPAAGQLNVTDVIEQVDSVPVATLEDWRSHADRTAANEVATLGVRRRGALLELRITAVGAAAPVEERPLGLTLRTVAGAGAAVVRVEPGSAAERAGLRAGDVLTVVDDVQTPTAPQASRAFAAASSGHPVLVGFTRDGAHHVIAMERTW